MLNKSFLLFLVFINILLFGCGVFNLDVKNPLEDFNVFEYFANDDSLEAKIYECKKQIDNLNWDKAVKLCNPSLIGSSNEALLLYASALHGSARGDFFKFIIAATDSGSDSIVEAYTNNIFDISDSHIDNLDLALSTLDAIATKDTDIYFNLGFISFTKACGIVRKNATSNNHPFEDIVEDDICVMSCADLNDFKNSLVNSLNYIDQAFEGSNDILNGISEVVNDIIASHWNDADCSGLGILVKKQVIGNFFGFSNICL